MRLLLPGGLALMALFAGPLPAQWRVDAMARGIGAVKHADPAPDQSPDTEAYLTQPILAAHLRAGRSFTLIATIDLESLTIPDGELTPGAWGEGFVDRRHPHTTVHELLLVVRDPLGRLDGDGELGLAAGKGFVPFGTDDPMGRPFLSYPVNHHLAQVLERAVLVAQYRKGALRLEGALFNGDEPERPGQWPLLRRDDRWRLGDSWSARLTVAPLTPLELQVSHASVHSPEHRGGAGGDQEKWSLAARWQDQPSWGERYAMMEWARTGELGDFFVFHSLLVEAAMRREWLALAWRYERTERPEEERLGDRYRSLRPHLENSILGTFRWDLHTVRVEADLLDRSRPLRVAPFVEVTLGRVTKVGGGIAEPLDSYGTDRVRHLSAGVAVGWRDRHHRMGRYGVLAPDPARHSH
jgi:hypothetical protein